VELSNSDHTNAHKISLLKIYSGMMFASSKKKNKKTEKSRTPIKEKADD